MFTDRRSVLAGLALVAATPAAMAQTRAGMAAAPMNPAEVKTAAQFYTGVLGMAEFSLVTSQVAVDKATQKNAHEFAGFELGEAITVNMVLKDIGTAAPAMDPAFASTAAKLKAASKGAAFDKEYIALQLENHQNLRDLADAYLHNTAGATDAAEKQGRHLGSLMLAVFKEHVAICKRIHAELAA